MQTLTSESALQTWTVISVDPDRLIEIGHKLKQHAMDFSLPGEAVTARLTDHVLLMYEPPLEMTKPVVAYAAPAILSNYEA